jgi:phage protein D
MDGTPGFYASRPIISVDGRAAPALGDALLQSLLVEERTAGLFRCEARFGNWGPRDASVGFLLFDRDLLDFGKDFAVEFGPPGSARRVFAGRIMGLEAIFPPGAAPELTVLAEDRFQDLRMTRRTRAFEDQDDPAVFRQVASDHGLTPELDLTGPTHRVLVQLNQSDLAFLRERAAACGAELWIEDRTLKAAGAARRDAGRVELTYGANLLEFSVLADLGGQRSKLRVSGWDVATKEGFAEEAGAGDIAAEVAGGQAGMAALDKALGERVEAVAFATPAGRAEATAEARARFARLARRFLTGTGVADGRAEIRVGSRLALKGIGPLFEGTYRATVVRHRFDLATGYRTEFEVERAGLGGQAA